MSGKKTPHIRKVKGNAVPAGTKAPPMDLLKGIKDLAKKMFTKKYESQKEIQEDQKKLNKMADKLPKTKKTEKLKKEVKQINFWDDDERKEQLLNIITMVLSLMLFYVELRFKKA